MLTSIFLRWIMVMMMKIMKINNNNNNQSLQLSSSNVINITRQVFSTHIYFWFPSKTTACAIILIRQSSNRPAKTQLDRDWKYGTSKELFLQRDTRLRTPRKRIIQILYSIMQINVRRIKLSLAFEWQRDGVKRGARGRSKERFLCFSGNKSLPAPIYPILSPFQPPVPSPHESQQPPFGPLTHKRHKFWRYATISGMGCNGDRG